MLLQVEGQSGCSRKSLSCRRGHHCVVQPRNAGRSPRDGGEQGAHARGHAGESPPHGELPRVQQQRVPVAQRVEELLAGQAGGEAEVLQMSLAQVSRAVGLHRQGGEGLFAQQPGLVSFRAVPKGAFQLLAAQPPPGAGRDGGRAVARVRGGFLRPLSAPARRRVAGEEVAFGGAAPFLPGVFSPRGRGGAGGRWGGGRGRADFARLARFQQGVVFAVRIAVSLAGAQICNTKGLGSGAARP